MKVGIFYFDKCGRYYFETYSEILKKNGIDVLKLNPSDKQLLSKVKSVDYVIFRWVHVDNHHQIAKTLLPVIEKFMGKPCYPSQDTCWHYDDKIKQKFLLESCGLDVVDSVVFWDKEKALAWAGNAIYPQVFKLIKGAGSNNVVLVNNVSEAKRIIKKMFSCLGIKFYWIPARNALIFHPAQWKKSLKRLLRETLLRKTKYANLHHWQKNKNYAYFQTFLPNNQFDIRITTIGARAFGFIRGVRSGDFRASGSGMISYDREKIDLRCVQIALEISRRFNFQSMAYDFIYNLKKEPVICEISYTYDDKCVQQCPGYWTEDLIWVDGRVWPQYLHLKDLLKQEDLIEVDLSKFVP